jgi:hypothetical protein
VLRVPESPAGGAARGTALHTKSKNFGVRHMSQVQGSML